MKHPYYQSGIFRSIWLLGIILSTVTFTTGCSSDLDEGPTESKATEIKETVEKDDTILRFWTMEELEHISISDLPGDNSGYELSELTYECTDTIELRALRLDVTATLTSATKNSKTIRFAAEVGPDLVSVEYYPGGEMIPRHCNMEAGFYPKVERYRNYSDGSRIGPDVFYDYGHGINISIDTQDDILKPYPSIKRYDMHTIPVLTSAAQINPDKQFYEDGVFYDVEKGIIEHNLNTTLIESNGKVYCGEDFFSIIPVKDIYDEPFFRNQSAQFAGNYYAVPHYDSDNWPQPGYIPSRLYDNEDEDFEEIVNLCRDVPDISPVAFPTDNKSLTPGWYFGEFNDRWDGICKLFSKHNIEMDNLFFNTGIYFYASING